MELTTWPMTTLGIVAAVCQVLAHLAMWDDGRPDRETRVQRYVTGTLLIFLAYAIGWSLDTSIHPVTGLAQIIFWSGLATWLCYELRRRADRGETKDAAARLIGRLEEELGSDIPDTHEGTERPGYGDGRPGAD